MWAPSPLLTSTSTFQRVAQYPVSGLWNNAECGVCDCDGVLGTGIKSQPSPSQRTHPPTGGGNQIKLDEKSRKLSRALRTLLDDMYKVEKPSYKRGNRGRSLIFRRHIDWLPQFLYYTVMSDELYYGYWWLDGSWSWQLSVPFLFCASGFSRSSRLSLVEAQISPFSECIIDGWPIHCIALCSK